MPTMAHVFNNVLSLSQLYHIKANLQDHTKQRALLGSDVAVDECSPLLFSHWVTPDSFRPYRLQHARLPCPPLSPRACSNSRPPNHLILWHPLLLLSSIFPSIRVFPSELALHIRWPKYWSFSFTISPSNEYSGLISFRMDLFDLFAVQGTLKSLLQHHSLCPLKSVCYWNCNPRGDGGRW